jgi:hypothetical protein
VRWTSCIVVLALVGVAVGQSPIQWRTDPAAGVETARSTLLPVLFFIPPSRDDERSEIKKAQDETFRTPVVREVVERFFVPIMLPRSSDNMQMMADMGAPTAYGMYLAVVAPSGKLVGVVEPADTSTPKRLFARLTVLFNTYRHELYARDAQPILERLDASPADVQRALGLVLKFRIAEADEAVLKLFERPKLMATLKHDVFQTLAALSTPRAVEALLDAASTDRAAAVALEHCTPAGAESMLPALKPDGSDRAWLAYKAITQIDWIEDRKYRAFWQDADEARKTAEIERVTRLAKETAARWRDEGGELREAWP